MILTARLRRSILPVLMVLLAAILLYAASTTQGFFTLRNAEAILTSTIFVGMVAVGMTLVMVSGSFVSLALGSTATVSAMTFMAMLSWGVVPAAIATILVAAMSGAIQGAVIGGWNANPVIVTIAASAVLQGLAIAFSNGVTINPTGTGYLILNERVMGLPAGVYALAMLVVVAEAVMRLTIFGRLIYLAGDRRAAARAAALPLSMIGTAVFAIAGACAGLAGIFMASFNHSASLLLNRGSIGYDAIAAVLIGGAAIGGGRGTISRTMLGVVFIAVVTDLVLLRGYTTGFQILLKGLVMIIFALGVHLRQESH